MIRVFLDFYLTMFGMYQFPVPKEFENPCLKFPYLLGFCITEPVRWALKDALHSLLHSYRGPITGFSFVSIPSDKESTGINYV